MQVYRQVFTEVTRRMRFASFIAPDPLIALLRALAELLRCVCLGRRHATADFLHRIKSLSPVFVAMPEWLQKNTSARDLETWSLLGPCLRVSTLPDEQRVRDQYVH